MGFLVRRCVRCGVNAQMDARGYTGVDNLNFEVFVVCKACGKTSIYSGQPTSDPVQSTGQLDASRHFDREPLVSIPDIPILSSDIPQRVGELFIQAAASRRIHFYDAAGAIFRKTIDVATKYLFATDPRLSDKKPADAPRARIQALGQFKILDEEIVDLADVALIDGNDAAHDTDPYTANEAEALEDLTFDLLDRLYVRPARIAAVKAKQIAAGQRKT
ncbi:DUF4145 domain-containing protein [Sinorhizobium fredii]|uniref:DUF4145 domain-containing protein n=1 Tax=Rhizobium fredii TaxID=380 RepID=UPI0009B64153|nr:DUF4145 domain-containing protein [Sinorhizobium fredii]